jgi:RNA polymerase subunit RPABC4/transcription elongation factor Spt4
MPLHIYSCRNCKIINSTNRDKCLRCGFGRWPAWECECGRINEGQYVFCKGCKSAQMTDAPSSWEKPDIDQAIYGVVNFDK